jgi:DNA-binding MarR family transcriptional regulator
MMASVPQHVNPNDDERDDDLLDVLVRTAEFRTTLRRFLNSTADAASEAGLTPQRYDLLLMIKAGSASGPVTLGSLCESLDLQQPAVTELVQRVELAGLVARERSPHDGRVVHLRLSDEGETRLAQVFQTLTNDRAALAEGFERLGDCFRASTAYRSGT